MKTGTLALLASMVTAMAAHAEEGTQLPPITVLGTPPTGAAGASTGAGAAAAGTGAAPGGVAHERCVDVTVGGERSFGCINQLLKKKVDQTNPTMNTPPIDARSPDLKTGVVNIPGVQQQYGQNFGKSAVPFRPPPVFYGSPSAPRR